MAALTVLTEREKTLLDLRHNGFRTTTVFVATCVWVMTLFSSTFLGGSPTIREMAFWLAVEVLCLIAYRVEIRYPIAARCGHYHKIRR